MNTKKIIIAALLFGMANSALAFRCIGLRVTGMNHVQTGVTLLLNQTNPPFTNEKIEMLNLNSVENNKALVCVHAFIGYNKLKTKAILMDSDGNNSTVILPKSCTKRYKLHQAIYIKGTYSSNKKRFKVSKCWVKN
jgi:hypothetical protein